MSAHPGRESAQSTVEPLKLWINKDWYIPVDEQGYCNGESAEGALGFVIKLLCYDHLDYANALKIPRLMGDTHRENAYICELMEQELKAVQFVERQRLQVTKQSLLGVANATPLLRGKISTVPGAEQGEEWDGAILLVSFEKGRRPRFCLAKLHEETLTFWPPSLSPITVHDYKAIEQKSQRWSQTVFVEKSDHSVAPSIFMTSNAFSRGPTGQTWYVGLPSVSYNWAPGTLQESISLLITQADGSVQSMRGEWSVKQHLELAEQICRALYALHARKMLHADLRPANIVFQAQPEDPRSYQVADYGSFAQTAPQILARPDDDFGQTMGPVVVGERASAFYAPERRLGREREAADTAVLWPEMTTKPCIKIVLGWRSDLIDDTTGQPRLSRIRDYINQAAEPPSELQDKILRAGDRLQLRENIFQLSEDEKRIGDKQVLTCEYNYWQIYHGRVAVRVPANEELKGVTWFPIPRTIELMKWSVATDLYSLGALLLYSIFRNKVDKGSSGSEVEDQFREMLAYLNSEPYFNAVWPELDWLRHCMEVGLEASHTAQRFSEVEFTRYDRTSPRQSGSNEPKTLIAAAEELANRLAQTAPGITRIIQGLEYNLAAFVFVMHFALCCLHRQSHFTSPKPEERARDQPKWKQVLPFCQHRRESPAESQATLHALERLSRLQVFLARGELMMMVPADHSKIGTFDPRPDVSIRIERDSLKRENDKLKPELESIRTQAEQVTLARKQSEQFNLRLKLQVDQGERSSQEAMAALVKLQQLLGEQPRLLEAKEIGRARELLRQAKETIEGINTTAIPAVQDAPEVLHRDLP